MRIQSNALAINANFNLKRNNSAVGKSLEKLASGYRINRAGDDASGLAVSEKMRALISGLESSTKNCQDAVSLVQTAEGALQEVHSMLQRMNELAMKSSNGTYKNAVDRNALQQEFEEIQGEIDRIGKSANFNGIQLFAGGTNAPLKTVDLKLSLNFRDGTCQVVDVQDTTVQTVSQASDGSDVGSTTEAIPDGYQLLAEKIADEYIPNVIQQIFDAFPSLETAVGSDRTELTLRVEYVDGNGGTLASAGYSYNSSNFSVLAMRINVDTADFSDASIQEGGAGSRYLESTIAHELMHTVMQYTMSEEMATNFPTWFKEGTAQLSGGGFPTNWNAQLEQYADELTDENDTSKDTSIESYLQSDTVAGNPYGHGYLACAYLGWLASGSSDVTSQSIAVGMDNIFSDILDGDSLYDALSNNTGLMLSNEADVEELFANPSYDMVDFIRKLSYNTTGGSNDGAGSVITDDLSTGGNDIIDSYLSASPGDAFYVGLFGSSGAGNSGTSGSGNGSNVWTMQIGPNADDRMDIDIGIMNTTVLGVDKATVNISTQTAANSAIDTIKEAINNVSTQRARLGAYQNRLEYTMNNLSTTSENIQSAESRIRDTDMAKEMMAYTKNNILIQAAQAMLGQANLAPQSVLALVQ